MSDEQVSSERTAISLADYLQKWLVIVAPTLVVAAIMWVLHLIWRHSDPAVFIVLWLPVGGTKAFYDYLREFHPERMPAKFVEDSPDQTRLKRKKKLLNWISYSGIGFCIGLGLITRLLFGIHPGEDCFLIPDVLWPWIALPMVVGFVAFFWLAVVEVQIQERTPAASKHVEAHNARPRKPVLISGTAFQGNGFRSEHWGEQNSNARR